MKDHWAYLKYVLRHKYYVLRACRLVKASLWRGLVHDLSKFSIAEWSPYVHTFYDKDGNKRYAENRDFELAWNHHLKLNPHHHQYWCLLEDSGSIKRLPMPEKYIREMLADWIGAGFAINGRNEVHEWYGKNKYKMRLHPDTAALVEKILEEIK